MLVMKYLLIFFIILNLGCSKVDVVFDYAPTVTTRFLDRYFDFSSERYDKVHAKLTEDFNANKTFIKAELIKRIDGASAFTESKELPSEKIEQEFLQYRQLQTQLTDKFKASISEIILNLTPTEIEHFKKEYTENRKKFNERFDNKEKFIKKMQSGFEKNMEFLFDDVTDEQIKIYTDFANENYAFYKEQAEFRFNTVESFIQIVEQKNSLLEKSIKFYSGDDSIKPVELKQKQEAYFKKMYQVTSQIWISLSSEQKKEFSKTLAELKSDLQELK